MFCNFFKNVNNFKLTAKHDNKTHNIFKEGAYDVDDISYMLNLEIKKINVKYEPIKLIVDFNRYQILIIVKENWQLILDKNFMKMLGFTKYVIKEGYHRPEELPQIDKTKYLEIYSNIVDNSNEQNFLTNVLIKNQIGDLVTYDNLNIYKKKKILETEFDYIEVCIKNQNNQNIALKDFYQVSIYIS